MDLFLLPYINDNKKVQTGIKNQKFECIICDFNTCKLSKYERHLLTKNIKKRSKIQKKVQKIRHLLIFNVFFVIKYINIAAVYLDIKKNVKKKPKKNVENEAMEGNSYHFEGNKKGPKKEEEKLDEELDEKDAMIKKLKKM